jgi:hypothetical protein
MSTQPATLNKRDEPSGGNPGEDSSQADQGRATDSAILKLTKTKQVFFHFEIGFKRTGPKAFRRAAEVQAPQIEQAVPQPVLAFSAGPLRQAAPVLDGVAASQLAADAGSGSSTSGGAVYVLLKGGTTVTPPDGYPPPP